MKNSFFLFFAVLTFSSCTHYYYLPVSPNVPLFHKKNEVRASASIGGGNEIEAVNGQVAYSLTNHLAVGATYLKAQNGATSNNHEGHGDYLDFSVGYFHPYKEDLVIEVFGGYGLSQQYHSYSSNLSAQLSYNRIFIQPSIGFSKDYFDFAFTPTLSRLQYQSIQTNLDLTDAHFDGLNSINAHKTSFLFEPTITLRAGWKYVKLQTQLTRLRNLSHRNLPVEKSHINVGLSIAFAERMLKKKSTARNDGSKAKRKIKAK
jgi:hypothetical protein